MVGTTLLEALTTKSSVEDIMRFTSSFLSLDSLGDKTCLPRLKERDSGGHVGQLCLLSSPFCSCPRTFVQLEKVAAPSVRSRMKKRKRSAVLATEAVDVLLLCLGKSSRRGFGPKNESSRCAFVVPDFSERCVPTQETHFWGPSGGPRIGPWIQIVPNRTHRTCT